MITNNERFYCARHQPLQNADIPKNKMAYSLISDVMYTQKAVQKNVGCYKSLPNT